MIELDQGGAGAAGATHLPVPADLGEWVEAASAHGEGTRHWKIVADDCAYLVLSQWDSPRGRAVRLAVVGARSRAIEVDLSRRRRTALLRLRPGALPVVTGVPGTELVDRSVSWHDATGDGASLDRFAAPWEQGDRRALLGLLGLVRDRIRRADLRQPDWRLRALLASESEAAPVTTAQRNAGVSPRTLHRAVSRAVGLAPSTVLRIRRLHRALLEGLARRKAGSRVALRHGFADQSHMIRECQALMGESPGRFVARGGVADPFNPSGLERPRLRG